MNNINIYHRVVNLNIKDIFILVVSTGGNGERGISWLTLSQLQPGEKNIHLNSLSISNFILRFSERGWEK